MAMMAFGCFIGNAQAIDTKAIYFETQGVEVMADFQRGNGYEIKRISLSAACGQNDTRCTSDSFQARMMDDFASALKYKRFYKYVYMPYDPCMEPGADCIPHVVDSFSESDVNELQESVQRGYTLRPQSTRPSYLDTFWTAVTEAAGSTAVGTVADHLKAESDKDSSNLRMYFVTTRLSKGQQIPVGVCKIGGNFCQLQHDINIRELVNGGIAVFMPVGDGSSTSDNAEYWDRENAVRDLLGEFEYKCIPAYTNSGNGLILQMVCSYMK
ncbi:hypothetical protein N473_00170 [Pseudoalteromonas luteoviolacea CPMOR-1]|uniref:Uncharacterized protein n=2 Tax=Pseudoalteromonas luteoviolacea TaxID=43657 RepID=A0A167NQK1_9GAMM|nr:hypothetical protein N473_00170 [Pseudoalteromonas luteoviolacea CPMOR-1]